MPRKVNNFGTTWVPDNQQMTNKRTTQILVQRPEPPVTVGLDNKNVTFKGNRKPVKK